MGSYQAQNDQVELKTTSKLIRPRSNGKLLGCWINQDLKWTDHLRDNRESLIHGLTTRLSALRKLQKNANFKIRKQIADGIFMSKLCYLMPLWGGCSLGLKHSLQVLQNRAARLVTRHDWTTPTKTLLMQCGWLSVNQLIFYHSVLLIFMVRQRKVPKYLYDMHNSWQYNYDTRQARGGILGMTRPRSELTRNSFRFRAAIHYNHLPQYLRNIDSCTEFKKEVKAWIKVNISHD